MLLELTASSFSAAALVISRRLCCYNHNPTPFYRLFLLRSLKKWEQYSYCVRTQKGSHIKPLLKAVYVRALIFNSSRQQLLLSRSSAGLHFHTELIMLYSVVPRFSLCTDYNIIHGCCQYFAPVMQAQPFLSVCTYNCS